MRKELLCILMMISCIRAASQNVGIGTTSPDNHAILDITASGKGLLIPRMDSATRVSIASPLPDGLMVFQSDGRKGFWYAVSDTWLYMPDKVQANDNLGNHTATEPLKYATDDADKILFTNALGVNGSKITHSTGWMLDYYAGPSDATVGTHRFFTGTPTGFKEMMRISENGNVGIGTTTPASILHIRGAENDGANAALKIESGTQRMLIDGNEIDAFTTAGTGTDLYLQNSGKNLLLANGGGYVGIGTTAPTARLSVNGDIDYTGTLEVGFQRMVRNYSMGSNSYADVGISCPVGTVLIGGGGGHRDFNAAQTDLVLNYSGPDPANVNRWRILVDNSGGTSRDVRVYALCAKLR